MILSAQQIFSDKQAVTATAISTNVIDLGVAEAPYDAQAALHQDVGKGNMIPILVQVTSDFAGLTSLAITLETSDAAALTSSTVLATESYTLAQLKAGLTTHMQYVPNGAELRYLGLRYTVTGSNASAGNITAAITMGNQTNFTGA